MGLKQDPLCQGLPAILRLPDEELLRRHPRLDFCSVFPEGLNAPLL